MNCDRSKALVAIYVDGELGEELAGPLRRHLMQCADCRASVSEAKAMASWFVPGAPISVPEGFAARVARLAASSDRAGMVATGAASGDDSVVPSRAVPEQRPRHLRSVDSPARFAMSLAAVAAAVLIGLTVLLASGDGRSLDGTELHATPPVGEALKVLDELNRREAAAAAGVALEVQTPAPR
jgi:anti-sigma factor RsiW